MSFVIFGGRPPFGEAVFDEEGKWTGHGANPGELIYVELVAGKWSRFDPAEEIPEGARFCVTNEGTPTKEKVDALFQGAQKPLGEVTG